MTQRIVVVDDNEEIRDLLRVILEAAGYAVEVCRDAVSLYQALRDPPHLILLDIYLRGTDGRQVCRHLKQDEQTRHIPIILMSAYRRAGEVLTESQADGFLEKPFHVDELLASVKQHI